MQVNGVSILWKTADITGISEREGVQSPPHCRGTQRENRGKGRLCHDHSPRQRRLKSSALWAAVHADRKYVML